ncbi:MAG: hypothetical protein M0C28_36925 [Candidatus Moduliflexus flocculans]|nr:hypothetical protein [Candidatus Moduliflexus flocculans]
MAALGAALYGVLRRARDPAARGLGDPPGHDGRSASRPRRTSSSGCSFLLAQPRPVADPPRGRRRLGHDPARPGHPPRHRGGGPGAARPRREGPGPRRPGRSWAWWPRPSSS